MLSRYPHSDPPSYPFFICKEGVVLVQIVRRNLSFYKFETKQTLSCLGLKFLIEKDVPCVNDTSDCEETNPSTCLSNRRRTYDLLVTSPDALSPSYSQISSYPPPSLTPPLVVTGLHSLKTALRILKRLGQKSFIEKDVFSVNDTSDSEETVPSTPNRRRTYDLLVTSPDAQPLTYRRLVRAGC